MRLLTILALAGAATGIAHLLKHSQSRRAARRMHPDERLGQTVRATLADLLPDPRAVRVTVNHGVVALRGSVSKTQRDDLLAAVLAVPGVTQVSNLLEFDERPEERVGLQGSSRAA